MEFSNAQNFRSYANIPKKKIFTIVWGKPRDTEPAITWRIPNYICLTRTKWSKIPDKYGIFLCVWHRKFSIFHVFFFLNNKKFWICLFTYYIKFYSLTCHLQYKTDPQDIHNIFPCFLKYDAIPLCIGLYTWKKEGETLKLSGSLTPSPFSIPLHRQCLGNIQPCLPLSKCPTAKMSRVILRYTVSL